MRNIWMPPFIVMHGAVFAINTAVMQLSLFFFTSLNCVAFTPHLFPARSVSPTALSLEIIAHPLPPTFP